MVKSPAQNARLLHLGQCPNLATAKAGNYYQLIVSLLLYSVQIEFDPPIHGTTFNRIIIGNRHGCCTPFSV